MVSASRVPSDTRAMVQPPHSLVRLSLRFPSALLAVAAFCAAADVAAAPTPASTLVPALVKATAYDRQFSSKAAGRVRIYVVYNSGESSSERAAQDLLRELAKLPKIAGLAHDENAVAFAGAYTLAASVRSEQISVVILSTGLSGEVASVAHELDGIDVLTAALDPDDVARGIVFGVDATGGKQKLVVKLAQARRQNVAFEASLLSLARVE